MFFVKNCNDSKHLDQVWAANLCSIYRGDAGQLIALEPLTLAHCDIHCVSRGVESNQGTAAKFPV